MARRHRPRAKHASRPRPNLRALGAAVDCCWERVRQAGEPEPEDRTNASAATYTYVREIAFLKVARIFTEHEAMDHAGDIACTVWERIICNEETFQGYLRDRRAKPSSFLWKCTVRAVIDVLRRTNRRRDASHVELDQPVVHSGSDGDADGVSVSLVAPDPSIEAELVADAPVSLLRRVFSQLELDLMAREITIAQAASLMGRAVGTVHAHRQRCLKRARLMLAGS
jgi:DNA-directed RNA polymerase specialized sigma24 family protein